MNYATALGTSVCGNCRGEFPDYEMSADLPGYCEPCGNERLAEIDARELADRRNEGEP